MKNKTLWTKNYTTITIASALGAFGGTIGGFALSYLVYDETQSTLAAALCIALKIVPGIIIPLFISPLMDRLPRKPFLVGCDFVSAAILILAGLWLKYNYFNYIWYLLFSLVLACISSFDELSYNAVYPKAIPEGMEEQGYSMSSMLFPVIIAVTTPLATILYKKCGISNLLIMHGVLCLVSAIIENNIKIKEEIREGTDFSLAQWWSDIKEAVSYMKKEKGILALTLYSSVNNGFYGGYGTIFLAFFSTAVGFTIEMYGFFTVVEMIGRTIGGFRIYKKPVKPEKKAGYALFVYLFYDICDAMLLFLSYPLMLINRTVCGYLGVQSGTMRVAAIQKYIPDSIRARISAFQSIVALLFTSVLTLFVGWIGDIMPYEYVILTCSILTILACLLTVVRNMPSIKKIYMGTDTNEND